MVCIKILMTDHFKAKKKYLHKKKGETFVTSECHVKRVICKTWTGTRQTVLTQIRCSITSDKGLHNLLIIQEVKG